MAPHGGCIPPVLQASTSAATARGRDEVGSLGRWIRFIQAPHYLPSVAVNDLIEVAGAVRGKRLRIIYMVKGASNT